MLPRKRAGQGEVVGESENTNNGNNIKDVSVTSPIKKHRICATAATDLTANNNTVAVGNNSSNQRSSSVVEPPIMALGNANHNDIDEDLHSWQLAVYGRETMRRLFASNILISGMQGLGAEIAKNLILAGVKSVTCMMKEWWSCGICPVILFSLRTMLVRTGHLLLFRSCRS